MWWGLSLTASSLLMPSPEEQLLNERRAQRDNLQALYDEYGGSELTRAMDEVADEGKPNDPENALGNALFEGITGAMKDIDRGTFEEDCLAIGGGETRPFFTDKGREFFSRPDVIRRCEAEALRTLTIERLEGEVGAVPDADSTRYRSVG